MFPAFNIVQHQHGARTRRQSGDNFVEVDTEVGRARQRLGEVEFRVINVVVGSGFTACRTQGHQRSIHRQTVQPSRERAFETKFGQFLPDANERILRQVFCTSAVAALQTQDDREYARRMPPVQALEGVPITLCGFADKRMIGSFRRHRVRHRGN